jgi:hypothetical protein
MPEETTKKCEVCDAVIAKDAKECPACKTDLETLDATISEMEKAEKVRAKRKAAAEAAAPPKKDDAPVRPKGGIFANLARKRSK